MATTSTRARPRSRTSGPSRARLQEFVDAARARHAVPGVAVGIVSRDRDLVAVSGVTSVDNPLPVDDGTLFMIGSTSKTFTATALMRLVDEGAVALDDLVTKHLPRFRLKDSRATRALTLRHLVTHTGGWDGDIDLDTGWGDDALARYVDAMRDRPQQTPVGSVWAYNNAGFAVAGRVIEVVTGKTYEQAVTELVLQPLGMTSTFFSPIDAATRSFAVGHISDGKRKPTLAHMWGIGRGIAPAGGVISTVRDQLTYARFHMGQIARGQDRVLRRNTVRLMQRDQFEAGSMADAVGISWLIRTQGGIRIVAHGGNVSNLQVSTFLMAPGRDFALTVLTNATNGGALGGEVQRWALERFLGLGEDTPELLDVDERALDQYAGTYASQLFKLTVSVDGGRLMMSSRFNLDLDEVPEAERELVRKAFGQQPPPVELRFHAPDRAVVVGRGAGARAEFIRERPGGSVRWLRWGGRLSRRA